MSRRTALKRLGDEPSRDDPNAALVAFRLPAACSVGRIHRRFRRTEPIDSLLDYLASADELGGVGRWTLREVTGGQGEVRRCHDDDDDGREREDRGGGGGGGRSGERSEGGEVEGGEKRGPRRRTVDDLKLFPRGVLMVRDETL